MNIIKETFEELMKRKHDNINEVNYLIVTPTSDWRVDYSEYDEKDGYVSIVIFKKIK
jgi:hypothetical protein